MKKHILWISAIALMAIACTQTEEMEQLLNTRQETTKAIDYETISVTLTAAGSLATQLGDNANIVGTVWEDVKDTAEVLGEKNFRLVDIDMQRYDFHLDSLSLAIGKASKDYALPYDRDGNVRDDAPDIGCYEYFKEE